MRVAERRREPGRSEASSLSTSLDKRAHSRLKAAMISHVGPNSRPAVKARSRADLLGSPPNASSEHWQMDASGGWCGGVASVASKEKRADPPAPPTAEEATAKRSEVVVDDEVGTEAASAASPSLPDQRPMPGPPPPGRPRDGVGKLARP